MFSTCGAGQHEQGLRKVNFDNNAMNSKGRTGKGRERHQSGRRRAIGEEKKVIRSETVWGNGFGRRVQAVLASSMLGPDRARLEVQWTDVTNPSHSTVHLCSLVT